MKRQPQQYVMKLLKRTNHMAFSCLCIFNNKSPLLSATLSNARRSVSSSCSSHAPSRFLSLSSLCCFGDPSLFKRKPLQSAAAFKMVCLGRRAAGRASKLTFHLKIWQPTIVVANQFLVSSSKTSKIIFYSFWNFFEPFWNFVNLCNCFVLLSNLLSKDSFEDLKSIFKDEKSWKKSKK